MNQTFSKTTELRANDLVQIIGVIRFSLPCLGGFKQKFDDEAHQKGFLFNAERMASRLKYFEKLCLHTLGQQSDPRFRLAVLIGQEMPLEYVNRLNAMTEGMTQITIMPTPVMEHRAAVQQAFDALIDPGIPFCFGFRLDDDDAVALDYIETLYDLAPRLLAISDGKFPVAAAFPKGFSIFKKNDDFQIVPAKMNAPPSAGVAVLNKSVWHENVYRFPHNLIGSHLPTLLSPQKFMYLRMIHAGNDAEHFAPRQKVLMDNDKQSDVLGRQFDLTIDQLAKL